MSSRKGSSFERAICVQLSQWWTDGAREDIFWRCAGSGARATTRHKGGKATAGSYGDIATIDAVGDPLIDLVTIELKRGYSQNTIHDLLDKHSTHKPSIFEQHIAQAITSHKAAGSFAWLLITRRDRRQAWAWGPPQLMSGLRGVGGFIERPTPFASLCVAVRLADGKPRWQHIWGTSLDALLSHTIPANWRALAKIA